MLFSGELLTFRYPVTVQLMFGCKSHIKYDVQCAQTYTPRMHNKMHTGIERVGLQLQALADILRSALCCHSNETRAPIANLPNSVQLELLPLPNLHEGSCSSVGMRRGTDRQTDIYRRP